MLDACCHCVSHQMVTSSIVSAATCVTLAAWRVLLSAVTPARWPSILSVWRCARFPEAPGPALTAQLATRVRVKQELQIAPLL